MKLTHQHNRYILSDTLSSGPWSEDLDASPVQFYSMSKGDASVSPERRIRGESYSRPSRPSVGSVSEPRLAKAFFDVRSRLLMFAGCFAYVCG